MAHDWYHDQVHSLQTMMPIITMHKLKEYDDLLLNQTKLINIHTQALQHKPSRWKAQWDKVQIIFQGMFNETFESQNVNETFYQHKLVLYTTTCPITFIYFFPWVLNSQSYLKNNSNFSLRSKNFICRITFYKF